MNLIELIGQYGALLWLMAGVVLLAGELVLPGALFLLLGAAAVLVGVLSFLFPLSWTLGMVAFAVLSAVSVAGRGVVARLAAGDDGTDAQHGPCLLVGLEGFLSEAIVAGHGRIELDGIPWAVTGPDLPLGEHVRVVALKAGALVVEASRAEKIRAV